MSGILGSSHSLASRNDITLNNVVQHCVLQILKIWKEDYWLVKITWEITWDLRSKALWIGTIGSRGKIYDPETGPHFKFSLPMLLYWQIFKTLVLGLFPTFFFYFLLEMAATGNFLQLYRKKVESGTYT